MKYFSYQESKEYLKSFQIESSYKFYRLVKSGSFDPRINKRPFDYFNTKNRKDWISWEDFLSFSKSEVLENKYLKFDDAKKIVHELRLKSQNDWNEWCKSQDMKMLKIPTNPNVVYKNSGWLSYSDWLGTVSYLNKKNINYLTYTDCKKFIKKNFPNIVNRNSWSNLDKKKLPLYIPKRPDYFYKKTNEWINWENFLDSKISPRSKSKLFLNFIDARKYVQSLEFKDQYEYYSFINQNNIEFLPKRPDYVYKKDWTGYLDFLGCENNKQSIGERLVRTYLEKNNIKFISEKKFESCKRVKELPFDFYLPEFNTCIEYDGELHYKSSLIFGGEETLKRIKINDRIKTKWCKQNSINLIRISYKNKNKIFEVLDKNFKNLNFN
jgi:hypothetical protein